MRSKFHCVKRRYRGPTLIAAVAAVSIAFALGGFFESIGLLGRANTFATVSLVAGLIFYIFARR